MIAWMISSYSNGSSRTYFRSSLGFVFIHVLMQSFPYSSVTRDICDIISSVRSVHISLYMQIQARERTKAPDYRYVKALSSVQSFWKSNFHICCAPKSVNAHLFDVFRAAAQMPQS